MTTDGAPELSASQSPHPEDGANTSHPVRFLEIHEMVHVACLAPMPGAGESSLSGSVSLTVSLPLTRNRVVGWAVDWEFKDYELLYIEQINSMVPCRAQRTIFKYPRSQTIMEKEKKEIELAILFWDRRPVSPGWSLA